MKDSSLPAEVPTAGSNPDVRRSNRVVINEFVLPAFGLVVLTLVAYSPVFSAGTIWDDNELIFNSSYVTTTEGLRAIWIAPKTDDFFPLTYSMFWLEYRLWGHNYAGYHVMNVLLHAVATVFIWRVLSQLKVPGAYVAATAFAVHPVCVATVAWIAEGKNTLSLALGAAAVWAYLKFDMQGYSRWYAVSLILFLLALLAKTSVVMIPPILLLLIWYRSDRCTKNDVVRVLPYFALSLVLGLVTVYFQHNHAIRGGTPRPEGMLSRIAATGWCLSFYLTKDLLPVSLPMVYRRWWVDASALASWLPLACHIGLFAVAWANRRTWGKPVLVAMGYFVAILAPVLGLVTMAFHGHSLVSDHLQYVAVVGPVALVVSSAYVCLRRHSLGAVGIRLAAVALVATLAVLTWRQSSLYRTAKTLWAHSLRLNDQSFAAHMNYAAALQDEQAVDEARRHMDEALRLQPGNAHLHRSVASLSLAAGKVDFAIANYREALKLDSEDALAHYNLALALQVRGDLSAAGIELREALRLRPDYAEAYNDLGMVQGTEGQLEQAVASFRRALSIDDGLAQAHFNLAQALASLGNSVAAIHHYRRAVSIHDKYLKAHNNLAWIQATDSSADSRNPREALQHARRAAELAGHSDPAVLDTLAAAYASAGQFDKAAATAAAAVRLAETHGLPVKSGLRRRLDMYRKHQPYRSPRTVKPTQETSSRKLDGEADERKNERPPD